MPPSFMKKKTKTKYAGEYRKSKIVSTYGCGAMVEFPGFSGVMGGINLWNRNIGNEMKIHEKNLEELLNKEYFVQPTTEKINRYENSYSVPVIRFPRYYYCPQCNELDYVEKLAKNYSDDSSYAGKMICNNCGCKELIPSRFILVCKNGDLEDFPYIYWAHKGIGSSCSHPKLTLKNEGKTGGLDSIVIRCKSCGAMNTMKGCLNSQAVASLTCRGSRPWLGRNNKCNCGKEVRVLMRGANNVYYPERRSALTIPPWSSYSEQLIDSCYDSIKDFYDLDGGGDVSKKVLEMHFNNKHWNELTQNTFEDFFKQVVRRFSKEKKLTNEKDIIFNEYSAFTHEDIDEAYFKTVTSEIEDNLHKYFKTVKIVRRLREVNVLIGFRRISAYSEEGSFMAPISSDYSEKWLPADEMLGEGVFIEFNAKEIDKWLRKNISRYDRIKDRYNAKKLYNIYGAFTPVQILIHTFSHLMIKKMSSECGYDASSLKEKLYINFSDEEKKMAGVLIYTSSSSSDGSFGGLARLGKKDNLKRIIDNMLISARWCANDPICIESTAQGLFSLNNAACYACSMVPETSCEMNNCLLDRFAIIGSMDKPELGYFEDLLN